MHNVLTKRVDWDPVAVKDELASFESRYGTSSADMHTAFVNDDGDLHETPDFRRWDFVYRAWKLMTTSEPVATTRR